MDRTHQYVFGGLASGALIAAAVAAPTHVAEMANAIAKRAPVCRALIVCPP